MMNETNVHIVLRNGEMKEFENVYATIQADVLLIINDVNSHKSERFLFPLNAIASYTLKNEPREDKSE